MSVYPCQVSDELVDLSRADGLYLRPTALINISVQLPQLSAPNQSISSGTVKDKLMALINQGSVVSLKVTKSSLEFIRFEGEVESRRLLKVLLGQLDNRTIKLPGFTDLLRVRAAEARISFPTRHDWDSFFRDDPTMNEMRPGERPDTIHLQQLPVRWFANSATGRVDEVLVRRVFSQWGDLRCVDVPSLDRLRRKMRAGVPGARGMFGDDAVFDVFVQYKEYMGFVKAMGSLKGMRLVYREGDRCWAACVRVQFDRTRHLSERSIKLRRVERERLMLEDRELDERSRRARHLDELKDASARRKIENEEREKKMREKRKRKHEAEKRRRKEARRRSKERRRQREEEEAMQLKIELEERKLLVAQRKLESIRVLDTLFDRVKTERQRAELKRREAEVQSMIAKHRKVDSEKLRQLKEKEDRDRLFQKEMRLRNKLVLTYKVFEEKRMEEQREKLRNAIEGQNKLRSVLARARHSSTGSSSSSLSSISRSRSRSKSKSKSKSRSRPRVRSKSRSTISSRSLSDSHSRSRSRFRSRSRSWSRSRSRSWTRSRSRSWSRSRSGSRRYGRMRMDDPSRDYWSDEDRPSGDPRMAAFRARGRGPFRGRPGMRGRGFAPFLYDADGNEWRGRGGRGFRRPWGRGNFNNNQNNNDDENVPFRVNQNDERYHYKRSPGRLRSKSGGSSSGHEAEIRVREDTSDSGGEKAKPEGGEEAPRRVFSRVWSKVHGWVDKEWVERGRGRPFVQRGGGRGDRPFRPFRGGFRGRWHPRGRGWGDRDRDRYRSRSRSRSYSRSYSRSRSRSPPRHEGYYEAYERYFMRLAERDRRAASSRSSSASTGDSDSSRRRRARRKKERRRSPSSSSSSSTS